MVRRRTHMSQDSRDLEGLEARRERARSRPGVETEIEEVSDGAPRDREDDLENITSPVELLSRELSETQSQLASDLGIDIDAPVSYGQFVKLLERVNDVKREERKNHRDESNRLLKAMGTKPPAEELRSLRIKVNVMWALLLFAVISAGSSLMTVAKYLKESGAEELQRQQLIEQGQDHEKRLRRLEWRGMDTPTPPAIR